VSFIVLDVRPYDFQDKESGRHVVGMRVTYVDSAAPTPAPGSGFAPMQITADADLVSQFSAVPGVYDLEFRQRAGVRSRPVLSLASARCLRPLDLAGI
jgi:hypothetical protein